LRVLREGRAQGCLREPAGVSGVNSERGVNEKWHVSRGFAEGYRRET
jgi:hypothetical protein